jgi:signal transduction histidine kinase
MIASQATRLSQITEEVLLTTRIDRDEVRVAREPVDVAELVRTTVQAFAPERPVDVAVEPDVPAASGDRDRIQQVLVNLLDNALKYGEPPVHVHVTAANGAVRIAVADQGPGVPRADQERIFEKFFRGDPHLSRSPGGTGLGLYISRELTHRMGGSLDVRSEPGSGATFVVELPPA